MSYIKVNNDKVTKEIAQKLISICPFDAFDYVDDYLSINANCRICMMCVRKGPDGVCELVKSVKEKIDKSKYQGITIYIEQKNNVAHPVSWELIGKAKELAKVTNEPIYAVVIGDDVIKIANEALSYGVDKVFVYENEAYKDFDVQTYTNVLDSFYKEHLVNIILFGSTPHGRSFAPRIAARLKTGITADCTMLEMTKDGDLLQIRPAFGGNIMAKINTLNNRPQLATVRHKMFDLPPKVEPFGEIVRGDTKNIPLTDSIKIIKTIEKPKVKDISEAEVIVAVGRAFKKAADLELIKPLVEKLNAEVGCTRPLVENGWFDARSQIGLSGRTVKPKLIINLGISGAVQYIEGMKDADLIISINEDKNNKLFDISHYSIVGDVFEILPKLNDLISEILQGER